MIGCALTVYCMQGHHHATAGTAPAERVAAIWPMWQQMTEDERTKLLTVKLDALRHRARALDEQSAASRPGERSHAWVLCKWRAGRPLIILQLHSSVIPVA